MTTIFEAADAVSSGQTAYALAAGDVFYGSNLHGASDWVAVTLKAGVTYSFAAVGIGAVNSGLTDPLIKLYSASGSLLAVDDDGGPGLSSLLRYTPTATQTCYVEVKALVSAGQGLYGLSMTEGLRADVSVPMGAAALYREGASWAGGAGQPVTVTWGLRGTGPGQDANEAPTALQALTAAQAAAVQVALGHFADVAGIGFQQVNPGGTTNAATILVGAYSSHSDGAGAYAYLPGSTAAGDKAGDMWINNTSISRTMLPPGSYGSYAILHELGHSMGLSHPGDYDAVAGVVLTYAGTAQLRQDSHQFTVMSYFMASATQVGAPVSYPDTLMLHDIYALQSLYGVNHATRAGNDVYGFNASVGGAFDFTVNKDPLLCIWDGAGRDRLDLSGFAAAQRIDLREGVFSDVGGFRGNLSIAEGCRIEQAFGGQGNDTLQGNALGNLLKGGPGQDVLDGGTGRDLLAGGTGADVFVFGAGDGQDRVLDFRKTVDAIRLDADLWGGASLTGAQVLTRFASLRGSDLVLDFGVDQVTLAWVSEMQGMASQILVL